VISKNNGETISGQKPMYKISENNVLENLLLIFEIWSSA
jgi:hypothetical protein